MTIPLETLNRFKGDDDKNKKKECFIIKGIEYCKHRIENEDNATTVKIYCAIENVLYAMIKK